MFSCYNVSMSDTKPIYTTTTPLHYNVTQGHIQNVSPNWPSGVASFPDNTYPEIFQVEMSAEIHNQHPIFRKYLAHQQPLLFSSDKKQAANDWIATWCDATFLLYASRIWGVCDLNEYWSNGDKPHDIAHKIAWAIAFLDVWNDWRARPELQHIIAVSSRAAVGNDIPIEVAEACQTYGAALSYHPYWPVNNGIILGDDESKARLSKNLESVPQRANMRDVDGSDYVIKVSQMKGRESSGDSARWFHQRWQQMDAHYKENGITVPYWVSTEIGAVGYSQSSNGDIHLHPDDGWRHPNVYDANMPAFIDSIKEWSQSVAEWNALNSNRFLGGQLFTTNLPHDGWTYFRITGDELVTIGNAMSVWTPDITPPPITDREIIVRAARDNDLINLCPTCALQKAIEDHGLPLTSNEYGMTLSDGSVWVCQNAGTNADTSKIFMYRFPVGDYDPSSLVIDEVRKV